MGLCTKCWCCPCLSRESSVIACTYLYAIMYIGSTILLTLTNPIYAYGIIIDILISVCLIFVILGLKMRKRSYLSHFKVTFGTFVVLSTICCFIMLSFLMFVYFAAKNEKVIDHFTNIMKQNFDDFNYSNDTISTFLKTFSLGIAIYFIIITIINWNYYLSTWDYLKEVIREIDNEKVVRYNECGKSDIYYTPFISVSGMLPYSQSPQYPQNSQYSQCSQYPEYPQCLQYPKNLPYS